MSFSQAHELSPWQAHTILGFPKKRCVMAMNRIQFQPRMSLFEFFRQFGTAAQCEAALEHARWPEGFRCPRCDGSAHCVLRVRARKTFQCNTCHHQTSLIAGTLV